MIKDEITKLKQMENEVQNFRLEIDSKAILLAREWMKIFGFGTDYIPDGIEIIITGISPEFTIRFEYRAARDYHDYLEQDIQALEKFSDYPPMENDRLILTYDQVEDSEKTKTEWQKRMTDWRRWFCAQREKEKKEEEACERERYEYLKGKYERPK